MEAYSADRSLKGKLRRRLAKLAVRRPAAVALERPMVSFSFDDAPATAADAGAAVLEAAGIRGTFFVCAGTMGEDGPMGINASADALRSLAERGHEIACHTWSHLDCGRAAADAIATDADRNQEALTALGLGAPATFAYPFGEVSVPAKRTLGGRFGLLRALHHGLVETGTDLNQAPAVGIEGKAGEAAASRWIEAAARRNAWLILYSHDVRSEPSPWGCSPQALERLAGSVVKAGFDVVTVAEGCRRIGALPPI
jgi:peptidoglycan/xylan/chitin deacetylase (PgdA/CDA1 family)